VMSHQHSAQQRQGWPHRVGDEREDVLRASCVAARGARRGGKDGTSRHSVLK
jgi:hypothetical protein